jgi:uncharacterized protein YukE
MNKNTIAFDFEKSKQSSRIIKAEADKISRQADKLARAVEESYQWWVGESHARFVKRAEALVKGMRKAAERINGMSETMTNAGEFWKEEEERIARELRALGSLMEGAISPRDDGKKIKEKEKGSEEAIKFIQEVEDKGVPFPKDWSHSDKVEFSYRYLSELDQIFARIDGRYETTDKLVNYDIAKKAEEEFLFLSDLDLAMHLTLEQRLKVRELFIEDKRYLNKVQDYLIEIGFSKDEAKSLSLKVSSAFIASEQGMSYHDWYTFLAAISILDGASKLEHSMRPLKDLHDNWKAQKAGKVNAGNVAKPFSGIRNAESDFTNAKGNSTLTNHFNRHGSQFGHANEQEYLRGARNFLEKPTTPTTQSFISKEGTYFRYDAATNEFGIMNKYGGVSTYYKPDDGLLYWFEQIRLYSP